MRGIRTTVLCVLGLVLATGYVAAGVDWPGYRGPGFEGAARDARLFDGKSGSLAVGWKRALGSGYSSLAVGDGRVMTLFAEGDGDFLAAYDIKSGDELWRYRIADTHNGHDGSHDGPISSPVLTDTRVYGLGPYGHLFALDASDGSKIWATHVVDDHGGKKPHYGFATAPVLHDGVLIVEMGGEEGKAIAGFDPDSGDLIWTAGEDEVHYHSPIAATIGGREMVLASGVKQLFGIDARSGKVLWSWEHGGDERAMGGATIVPVPTTENRFFIMNKMDGSSLIEIGGDGGEYEVKEIWSGNGIKQSYVTPVYKDGYIYGMNNRIFTCVDAATGETKWRSREPGDGFPTIVGDHIVVITKPGSMHVVEATPEEYREVANLELFDEHAWSEVAFGDGFLYARSMGHLARVDPTSGVDAPTAPAKARRTEFDRFLEEVALARDESDKSAVVDAFLATQRSFPIVEGPDTVHFVYRGEAEDVGVVGDMIGFRREDAMTRVAGTDLFYYSMKLEPNAGVTYGFITDFGEPAADPRNPAAADGLFGEVSWLSMPAWHAPDHVEEAVVSRQGRLEPVEWESEVREDQKRTAQVYLPAGYDAATDTRYPVAYIHAGKDALEDGGMKNALDNLIGETVEPLIAVFVMADEENPGDLRDEKYMEMVVKELVPKVDSSYNTIAEAAARANIGAGGASNVALNGTLANLETFGRIGMQSLRTMNATELAEKIGTADEQPLVIYMDWGTYHMRSPHEAWDLADGNRETWSLLRERGYRPAGGELPEGYSWAAWRAHTDELLSALFPLR